MKTLSERVPVLSKDERAVLRALHRATGRRTLRQLATASDSSGWLVRKAIDRLDSLGFVHGARRSGDPVETYRITPNGRQFYEEGIVRETPGDRPSIAGHPLPWSIVQIPPLPPVRPTNGDPEVSESEHAYLVDGDGYQILRFYTEQDEGRLLKALVEHLAKRTETMADLALAEKAAKVAKLRLENDRAEGADPRRIADLETGLVKVVQLFLKAQPKQPVAIVESGFAYAESKAQAVLDELGLAGRVWDYMAKPEARS